MKQLIYCLALLCPLLSNCQQITIKGNIINEEGNPVPAATISIKGTNNSTVANAKGEFTLPNTKLNDSIMVSAIGYQTATEPNNMRGLITVILKRKITELDETVIMAYGTTTKRFSTGNIAKISAAQIGTQPVSNPLAALQGRVPGLFITQNNGLPGSTFNIQLRGQNSIAQGSQPLFIIDGVPLMFNSGNLGSINAAVQNPFNTLNTADIESIEILKDADATAIYGAQGANGVVLITTKKGKAGKTSLDLAIYHGLGNTTRLPALLNTQQYLQMRKEALANDGLTASPSTDPDLLVWEQDRYTNWPAFLMGSTATTTNLQATLSGGNSLTRFQLSANWFSETPVFPQSKPATRSSVRLSVNHANPSGKFKATLTAAGTIDKKQLPLTDLTAFILLPPNAPALFDTAGNLQWTDGLDNPMSYRFNTYNSTTHNFTGNAVLQYRLAPSLVFSTNLGYNFMQLSEQRKTPIKAQRPSATTTGSTQLVNALLNGWITEPQLSFKQKWNSHNLELLAGLSFQQRVQQSTSISASLYNNDDLLGNLSSAGQLAVANSYSLYRYNAVFGRIAYRYQNKYLININLRRDGSSRFGPANRFSNFAAAGTAWVFTEEEKIKQAIPFISFGKLRLSYGLTGNDQVGDYQYLDTWSSLTAYQYQGTAGVLPSRLFNPYYGWERTKKLEAALELQCFNDRISVTTVWFRNRSDNQLVFDKLPNQTGFPSILRNLDALIENSGWEWSFSSTNLQAKQFTWKTEANLTIPVNKLLRYPALELSANRYTYQLGQPLTVYRGFQYNGINPQTGLYSFSDADNDGNISSPNDLKTAGWFGPRLYGGLLNTLNWKNWSFTLFIQWVKQTGRSYTNSLAAVPGTMSNQPSLVLHRWQKQGDNTSVQRFTSSVLSPAYTAWFNLRSSSDVLVNASFLRLKNVELAYSFSKHWLQRNSIQNLRIYMQAQNLFTLTPYKGTDPESQNILSLPPLNIVTAGINITL